MSREDVATSEFVRILDSDYEHKIFKLGDIKHKEFRVETDNPNEYINEYIPASLWNYVDIIENGFSIKGNLYELLWYGSHPEVTDITYDTFIEIETTLRDYEECGPIYVSNNQIFIEDLSEDLLKEIFPEGMFNDGVVIKHSKDLYSIPADQIYLILDYKNNSMPIYYPLEDRVRGYLLRYLHSVGNVRWTYGDDQDNTLEVIQNLTPEELDDELRNLLENLPVDISPYIQIDVDGNTIIKPVDEVYRLLWEHIVVDPQLEQVSSGTSLGHDPISIIRKLM